MDHLQTVIGFSDSTDIDIQKLKTRQEFEHSLAILQLSFGRHYDIMGELATDVRDIVIDRLVKASVACVIMTDAIYLGPAKYGWNNEFSENKVNILCYGDSLDSAMEHMALWLQNNQDHKDYTGSKIQYSGMRTGHLNRIVKPARLKE